MLMIFLVTVPAVFPLSIVKYVPMEEESYTNTIYRKAYNLVPGLKRLRAKSPAEGKDFVSAVVTGLSAEFVGTGVRDVHTWVQNNQGCPEANIDEACVPISVMNGFWRFRTEKVYQLCLWTHQTFLKLSDCSGSM